MIYSLHMVLESLYDLQLFLFCLLSLNKMFQLYFIAAEACFKL